MKAAYEIMKGIECCYFNQPELCRNCPYSKGGIDCGRSGAQIIEDALEYIKTNEKLNQCREDIITTMTEELKVRDAALKDIIKLYLFSEKET